MAYEHQVELLLEVLPYLKNHTCFALKGGTAINLFLLDMPRLSIDIDLTYTRLSERAVALDEIQTALDDLYQTLQDTHPQWRLHKQVSSKTHRIVKLLISNDNAAIKIEPNEVLRGILYPVEYLDLCHTAQTRFNVEINEFPCLSSADLYGGKLCATLDRQHPRDLFDIKLLVEGRGLTSEIINAFVVYLCCHSRPMHELLQPKKKSLDEVFNDSFLGMTKNEVSLSELIEIQAVLPTMILHSLSDQQKSFLMSVKQQSPDWSLMPLSNIQELPGIKWKLMNLKKMDTDKHRMMIAKLERVLFTED